MRPLIAALVVIVILGGLQLYMTMRVWYGPAQAEVLDLRASGTFSVEVTTTFDVTSEPDPFAANPNETTAISLTLRDRELLDADVPIMAGMPVVVSPVEGIVVGADAFRGRNELLLTAVVPPGEIDRQHAVRVRLLRDDETIADETFWADTGDKIVGRVQATIVDPHLSDDEHEH